MQYKGFSTKAIHVGKDQNHSRTLATPIYATSTFVFDSAAQGGARFKGEEDGYIYSRIGNPTCAVLEAKLAALECAEAALVTASGMGAINIVCDTFLQQGDHLIADETLYGCTFDYFRHGLPRHGIAVSFVDTRNAEAVKAQIRKETRMVFFESPANPNCKLTDIAELTAAVHEVSVDILVVCDNTFCTPYLQQPLTLGCDIVVHSLTKYINGHGDVIAGAVIGNAEMMQQCRLFGMKDMCGSVLSAFDAYLVIRGLKTLEIRMQKHCENAMQVARYLHDHPLVGKIYYPGLEDDTEYAIAKKQMHNGFGGILSFELRADCAESMMFLNHLQLCTLAVSLGDCETLIQHPASMTHAPYSPQERKAAGISEGLIRLSVGLEAADEIIADLTQALDKLL